ncbi:RagB/SusD family nutrient uptake outer membrane protein [Sphingobacterium sp. InxBP1]|uniref:RagB/SusD family nutrient uptake outer membrane protein n=1 Tax=Sphingobacterium sp. InxBP1 TaxID=2870328 RepID=UPI002243D4FD|nr:RagB/SusD family nutrient uptake outer membrane protein [Sphingobacterium sp. InxBP1]MCW8313180.1 RagB/SusD family nutrient uptake outer membrane protein [Sphingobacterium sp. InxBP1]
MKTLNKFTHYIACIGLLLMMGACEKYLDKSPLDGPSDENYFKNQDELTLVVNGLYSALAFHPTDDMPINLTLDDATDIGWDRNTSDLQAIGRGDYDSNNGYIRNIWTNSYKVIGKCNFILDNIHKLDGKMDANLQKRYKAETQFIRAYVYQYLIDYFGGVPLVTNGLNLANANLPKTTKAEIAAFILKELDEAAASLPISYGAADVGRATKGAALAIRARAALNNGLWEEAARSAKEVMDLKIYQLHPDFGQLFTYDGEASKEIIFAFQYLRLQKTKTHSATRAFLSRNAQGTSNKIPSQSIVDNYLCTDGLPIDKSSLYDPKKPFVNRDPRLAYTIALPGTDFFGFQFETHKDSISCWNYSYNTSTAVRIQNQDAINAYATFSGYCWKKYVDIKDKDFTMESELNIIQSRYAEVLLIYAEAMIESNKIDQSVYDAINSIRQRPTVAMPAVSSGKTQNELREVVRKERLFELANEGFRMVDLRRWKLADKLMNSTLYGRIPKGLLANAPIIDTDSQVNYNNVANKKDMRIIEIRKFDANKNYLWPIPNIEIVTNKNLEQNPGY